MNMIFTFGFRGDFDANLEMPNDQSWVDKRLQILTWSITISATPPFPSKGALFRQCVMQLPGGLTSKPCQQSVMSNITSMAGSINGGTPKWMVYSGKSHKNEGFWGTPIYLWKPHIFAQQSWMYILKKPLFLPVLVKPLVMCCFPFKWRNKYVESYQPVIHFFGTGGYLQQTRSSLNRLGDTFIYIYMNHACTITVSAVSSTATIFPAINILPMCPNPKCTQAAGILCERLRTTVDRLFTVPL